jgi:hypothetical protein
MAYFSSRCLFDAPHSLRHELLIESGWSFVPGLPAWIALSLFAGKGRVEMSAVQRCLLLAPVAVALALLLALAVAGGL